jgi:hypothetical protein
MLPRGATHFSLSLSYLFWWWSLGKIGEQNIRVWYRQQGVKFKRADKLPTGLLEEHEDVGVRAEDVGGKRGASADVIWGGVTNAGEDSRILLLALRLERRSGGGSGRGGRHEAMRP